MATIINGTTGIDKVENSILLDNREPNVHLHAYCSSSYAMPAGGSLITPFNSVYTNTTNGSWNSSSNTFTVQISGIYLLSMILRMDSVSHSSPHVDIRFWINNQSKYDNSYTNIYDMRGLDQTPDYWSWQKTMFVHLDVGDTIRIYSYCNGTTPSLKNDTSHLMISLMREDV